MVFSGKPPLTDEELTQHQEDFRTWRTHCESKEYCLMKIAGQQRAPSQEALSEATALVDEQILVAGDLFHPNNGAAAAQSLEVFREEKMAGNAYMEHYGFALYETLIFEEWHISRYLHRVPERRPTAQERLRFEKVFYEVARLFVASQERFDILSSNYDLAELNRLENLASFLVNLVQKVHDTALPLFKQPKGNELFTRLKNARHDKGVSVGFPNGGHYYTRNSYVNSDMWAVLDEVQPVLEYECAEDPKNGPPTPPPHSF